MSDLLTHIERSELVDVDLDKEPQCESRFHAAGAHPAGSVHAGPAAYWQVGPCAHLTGLRCAAAVHSYRNPRQHCSVCGVEADLSVFRFIEL